MAPVVANDRSKLAIDHGLILNHKLEDLFAFAGKSYSEYVAPRIQGKGKVPSPCGRHWPARHRTLCV